MESLYVPLCVLALFILVVAFVCYIFASDVLYSDNQLEASQCEVFSQYSPNRKREYLKKSKLSLICSLPLSDPRHQVPCVLVERFKCKVCTEAGNISGAKSHHTELHLGPNPNENRIKKRGGKEQDQSPAQTLSAAPPAAGAPPAMPAVMNTRVCSMELHPSSSCGLC